MKAVLMAGGEGSRLRPLTVGRPKPLVPIVNKTVMGHILDLLKQHGITEVVITLRYMAAAIQDLYEDGRNLGMNLTYVVEEYPLGTAGSVKNAAKYLDDTFLVISGDALTDFDLGKIIETHKQRGALASLALSHVPNPLEYGVIVTDEEGRIKQFLEKPSWGEVISDTVNTGIYVLEPSVLDLIPGECAYDFAGDLFPCMLEQELPLYGHIVDGYWCDVGTIEEYHRANADMLFGKVRSSTPFGTHIGNGIWVGEDVDIAPSAQLYGPIYLGNGVKIKGDVVIYGPTVVRDYTIVDNYSRVERTVLWRNNYIGENCELRGVIITRQCSLKSKVLALEGVVISDNCILGEGSILHADVKLWPNKEIEPGAIVKDSIIWGNQRRRALFGRHGVTGTVNVDLTPEFAAKLGAALGATLPRGSFIAINRDPHRASRMLKRALISGIPGTGLNVWDLGSLAIPVLRYFVRNQADTTAGIHVRLSPFDQRVVDIRVVDHKGMNQSKSAERAIERTFFREDFRRAFLDEIGLIQYATQALNKYTETFLSYVDVERIRNAHFRVVIDYSYGLAADTLANILNKLGVEVVTLNARTDETKLAMLQHEFHTNLEGVAKIVEVLKADLGIQFDVGGEKIFIVDEKGQILDEITTACLMLELALYANPGHTVVVPATMPNCFDVIAGWHQSHLMRININLHSLMQAADNPEVLLAADGNGSFIFPEFQSAVDGLMAVARLLQYLAIRAMPISHIVEYLPAAFIARDRVSCPAGSKGAVMRRLSEQYAHMMVNNIDGVKIHLENGEWVHAAPDPDLPYFQLIAEGNSPERAGELIAIYRSQLEKLVPPGPPVLP